MSARQRMGSIIPDDSCPPNTEASNGTEIMPAPCTPVFDIPTRMATRKKTSSSPGEKLKEKKVFKKVTIPAI